MEAGTVDSECSILSQHVASLLIAESCAFGFLRQCSESGRHVAEVLLTQVFCYSRSGGVAAVRTGGAGSPVFLTSTDSIIRCGHTAGSITMTAVKEVEETMDIDLGSLLDAGDDAIVTLVAGDTRLAAYRAVLAARSPVFKAMFQHETLEATSGQVTIPDIEGPVLRQLLVYFYTLRAPQLASMAPQLLAAADKYGLLGLKADCEQQLATQLAVGNAAATAVLAVRHSCPSLMETVVMSIKAHTHQVMATEGWADAVFNEPKAVVEISRFLTEPSTEIRSLPGEVKGRRLIQAAKEGAVDELETLLAAGADVEARDDDMMTALHWAAEGGHMEAVTCLLEGDADVRARNSWKSTPLHYAAQNGHVAVVQLLLESCADVNARGSVGQTPLHYAAQFGHINVVKVLLEGGADKVAKTVEGRTPLEYAMESKQQLTEMLT